MWQASVTGKIPDKFDLICFGNELILYRSGMARDSTRVRSLQSANITSKEMVGEITLVPGKSNDRANPTDFNDRRNYTAERRGVAVARTVSSM